MERKPRTWLRGALTLGVIGVVGASLMAAPVSAHFFPKDERKHVRKIARRIARRESRTIVNTFGQTLFVEETELQRFGPISLSATSPDQTIGTFGPFTLKAHCDEDPAGALVGQILISTTAEHSALNTDDSNLDDFGPADADEVWADTTDAFPDDGTQEFIEDEDSDAVSMGPLGANALSSLGNLILLNGEAAGAPDCLFAGAVLQVTPS